MRALLLAAALLMLVCPARAETLDAALESTLTGLSLNDLEEAYQRLFPEGQDMKALLLSLAKGETALEAEPLLRALSQGLLKRLTGSLGRLTLLLLPAILCGILEKMKSAFASDAVAEVLRAGCFLLLAGTLARDVGEHMALCRESVRSMADLMQKLFPLLLTLLAALGGTAGAAFFQPAVTAACGTMTGLVRSVTLPLAAGAAVVSILDHLSPRIRVGRLSALLRTLSTVTLGVSFTVFISVTALQSIGAAAADGVTLRTAKYAVDNFVPVVGGMFADTMDTLVGASLMIKNALGIAGLLLLLFTAGGSMLQTLAAVLLYRAAGALLEPVAEESVSGCLHAFSDTLMTFFIIQLSVGAMFLLLAAQLLAVGNLTVMLR